MPGANQRALEKGQTLPCDVIIMDLEDAVSPGAKEEARGCVAAALRNRPKYGHRELVVRVNHPSTPWAQGDLDMILAAADDQALPDAVLLPKVESPGEVEDVAGQLQERLSGGGGGGGGGTEIAATPAVWTMIETPLGVLRAADIAEATARADNRILDVLEAPSPSGGPRGRPPPCMAMGTADLAKELRVAHTTDRSALLGALMQCVIAGRAHHLDLLDGVHLDLDDDAGFDDACRQGRGMGFDGKTLIHPKTIAAANAAFSPSAAEVDHARRVVEAYEAATREGKGVAVLDGRLVEILHHAEARRLLQVAGAIGELAGGN